MLSFLTERLLSSEQNVTIGRFGRFEQHRRRRRYLHNDKSYVSLGATFGRNAASITFTSCTNVANLQNPLARVPCGAYSVGKF